MSRRVLLVLMLCAGLLIPGRADAATTFTFYGSGWGHGIGMSQWGAFGLATKGWGPVRIVKHYYLGTNVATLTPPAKRFRIGILQYHSEVTLKAEKGPFRLVLSSGRVMSRVRAGATRKVLIRRRADGRDIYKILNASGRLLTQGGSPTNHLLAVRGKGAVIRVVDTHWPHMVGRGKLQFNIVGRASAHLLVVVAAEAYLFGLAEVPSSWDADALQAQAIAARSYAWEKIARLGQNRSGCKCGLFATTADQFYVGWDKEVATAGDRWVAAVRNSARQVARHDGATIPAFYSSASGGHTEHIQNVWTGSSPQPYLRGVCDPAEYDVTWPNTSTRVLERWSQSFGASTLTSRLRRFTGNIGTVKGFTDFQLGVSGRVRTVRVLGNGGSKVVAGWNIRSALGLRDTKFSVNSNRTVTGRIRQAYDNMSCRPGIAIKPQRTIKGGQFQEFKDRQGKIGRIYFHKARNRATWIRGPILTKYKAKRGHGGILGLPYRWLTIDGGAGRRARFDNGEILWRTSDAEAFAIHRPILGKYVEEGGFKSLGYPITDVENVDDGDGSATTKTRRSVFDNGIITCTTVDGGTTWDCTRS